MGKKKITPNEFFIKIKNKFTYNKKSAFFSTVVIAIIVYFKVYANEIYNPDTLYVGINHGLDVWEMSLGRWGLSIVSLLRGSLVSTVATTFITIIVLGIVSIILTELLNIKKPIWIILTSAILVTAPTFAIIPTYTYCADAYTIAMLLSVLSVYFIYKRKDATHFLLASICVMLSLGLYQTYIGVTVGLCVIIPILKVLENKESNKEILIGILKSILMVALGALIYYIFTQMVLVFAHIELSSYGGADKIGISIIKTIPQAIKQTYTTFYQFFFGDNILKNTYWMRHYINGIIFLTLIIAMAIKIIKNKTYKKPSKIAMLIFFVIIFPISLNIIELIAQERKINLLMGASSYLLFIMLIAIIEKLDGNTWKETIINWISLIVILILVITYALQDQSTYIAREYTYNQAYSTMIRVIDRIETNENYEKGMKICIAGTINQQNYPRESKIYDMAEGYISNYGEFWENYSSGKVNMDKFLEKNMGIKLKHCTDTEYVKIILSEEFEKMGVFPDKTSVKVIDNVMVVKFSDDPLGIKNKLKNEV